MSCTLRSDAGFGPMQRHCLLLVRTSTAAQSHPYSTALGPLAWTQTPPSRRRTDDTRYETPHVRTTRVSLRVPIIFGFKISLFADEWKRPTMFFLLLENT
ncbi:hypothetical protein COCON_G00232200 [Conger conger]|uniref:Uncharacterized protein n=1 Tax=Conger conger TaxID=82655 RepID=A0A9Q1CVH3_CONCO|nr:hypothetical protein COCON_G00232200 [Conger conger]